MLTRGTDVWLNNPRRPLEACGTSGMKAAMNGVLNASILDGWLPEACRHGVKGWAIGDESVPATVAEQDERDAIALYQVLLNEIVPTYYGHRARGREMMRASIETTSQQFAVDRQLLGEALRGGVGDRSGGHFGEALVNRTPEPIASARSWIDPPIVPAAMLGSGPFPFPTRWNEAKTLREGATSYNLEFEDVDGGDWKAAISPFPHQRRRRGR